MYFEKFEKTPKNNNLKKPPHSLTLQCMGRVLGHLAAHMKDFMKNGSQIKKFKNSVNFAENFQL